ncbi:hypothetical protein GCM10027271_30180 [Saccharopolyspora gloriosae]
MTGMPKSLSREVITCEVDNAAGSSGSGSEPGSSSGPGSPLPPDTQSAVPRNSSAWSNGLRCDQVRWSSTSSPHIANGFSPSRTRIPLITPGTAGCRVLSRPLKEAAAWNSPGFRKA